MSKVSLIQLSEFTLDSIEVFGRTRDWNNVTNEFEFTMMGGNHWYLNQFDAQIDYICICNLNYDVVAYSSVNISPDLIGSIDIRIEITSEYKLVTSSSILLDVTYRSHILNANEPIPTIDTELVGKHIDQGLLVSDTESILNYVSNSDGIQFIYESGKRYEIISNGTPIFNQIKVTSESNQIRNKSIEGYILFNRRYDIPTWSEVRTLLNMSGLISYHYRLPNQLPTNVRIRSDEIHGIHAYVILEFGTFKYLIKYKRFNGKIWVEISNFSGELNPLFPTEVMSFFKNDFIQLKDGVILVTNSNPVTYTSNSGDVVKLYSSESSQLKSGITISSCNDLGHCVFDVPNTKCLNPLKCKAGASEYTWDEVELESGEILNKQSGFNNDDTHEVPFNLYFDFESHSQQVINSLLIAQYNCIKFITKHEWISDLSKLHLFDSMAVYLIENDNKVTLNCIPYFEFGGIDYLGDRGYYSNSDRVFRLDITEYISNIEYIDSSGIYLIIKYKDGSLPIELINILNGAHSQLTGFLIYRNNKLEIN